MNCEKHIRRVQEFGDGQAREPRSNLLNRGSAIVAGDDLLQEDRELELRDAVAGVSKDNHYLFLETAISETSRQKCGSAFLLFGGGALGLPDVRADAGDFGRRHATCNACCSITNRIKTSARPTCRFTMKRVTAGDWASCS